MADVRCRVCGEPWDLDCLHDEAQERYGTPYYLSESDRRARRRNPAWNSDAYDQVFERVRHEFQQQGCIALHRAYGCGPCAPNDSAAATAAGAVYDLLGEDLDGAAGLLCDIGL